MNLIKILKYGFFVNLKKVHALKNKIVYKTQKNAHELKKVHNLEKVCTLWKTSLNSKNFIDLQNNSWGKV